MSENTSKATQIQEHKRNYNKHKPNARKEAKLNANTIKNRNAQQTIDRS